VPGYRVYRANRFQFRGGVLLLVKNNVRHDHFIIPNVVNVETVGVCLYLQDNIRRLFVFITHPTHLFCTLTLILFFSSFSSVVLVGVVNRKHTVWNCISIDRNGRTLLSVYPKTLQ